jgi:hypothetical protein
MNFRNNKKIKILRDVGTDRGINIDFDGVGCQAMCGGRYYPHQGQYQSAGGWYYPWLELALCVIDNQMIDVWLGALVAHAHLGQEVAS